MKSTEGCIKAILTARTVSAPGAMIVNMPVLAASGVAGVTVTVAAGSVSVASARRFRVKYDDNLLLLLLPAAAPVMTVGSRTTDAMTGSCSGVAAAWRIAWSVAIVSTAALVDDDDVVPAVAGGPAGGDLVISRGEEAT